MNWESIFSNALRAAFNVEAAVYALAAIGLNLHFGYTGLLNFGQAAFLLVGAYGIAITVATYAGPLGVGIAVGLFCAVVLALLLGVPTLRLRADYLAITTIAAAEILRLLYRSEYLRPITGGVFGLQQFAGAFYAANPIPEGRYSFLVVTFSHRDLWAMSVGWLLVALSALLLWRTIHSPWGRVVRSVREDEDAARSLGKNVFGFKMQSLVIGGVMAAAGGMVLALSNQAVTPDTYNPVITFYAYTVLILGGAARVAGPVLGSVIFWFVLAGSDAFIRQAIATGLIPAGILAPAEVGAVRFALVGLALMVLMIYRPQGMFGNREELLLDAR